MAFIKYIGSAHFRVFRSEDFSRLGVEGVSLVKWAKHEVVELMDDAVDALLQRHGDEFEKVTEAPSTVSEAPSVFLPAQATSPEAETPTA